MKIKDLTINEIINFCSERESCLGCPFKTVDNPKPCVNTLYQAEKIRRENIRFLTDEDYEKLGNIEIERGKKGYHEKN